MPYLAEYASILLPFLNDEAVVEISLTPSGMVFVERWGSDATAQGTWDAESADRFVRFCASRSGFEFDRERPIVSARVPGTRHRLEALLPPLVEQVTFSIRRHREGSYSLTSYAKATPHHVDRIREGLKTRKNILVTGGPKSGKTSLMNACLSELFLVEPQSRVLSIEDIVELQLPFENKAQLYSSEHVSMTRLLESSLRLAPDRIMVGEVRTGDTLLTMLKAWNTGNPGGLASLHVDGADQAMARMTALLLEVTSNDLTEVIRSSVDWIVHIERGRAAPAIQHILNLKTGETHE